MIFWDQVWEIQSTPFSSFIIGSRLRLVLEFGERKGKKKENVKENWREFGSKVELEFGNFPPASRTKQGKENVFLFLYYFFFFRSSKQSLAVNETEQFETQIANSWRTEVRWYFAGGKSKRRFVVRLLRLLSLPPDLVRSLSLSLSVIFVCLNGWQWLNGKKPQTITQ